MEYARGRLFKDPSLPVMTAEERKVRVERRGGGGGHSKKKYSGTTDDEGLTDWQNMFALTNFRYIEEFVI